MENVETKLNQLEERIRSTETAIATLTTHVESGTAHLKENLSRSESDLKETIIRLRDDMKENHRDVTESVNALNQSLQNLYISHSSEKTSVKFNEKIIWGLVGLIFTAGLYLLQDFIKISGAG